MKTDLFECLDLFESGDSSRVDREGGVIHGVKILGWSSANGREYLPEGVDPKLYEGRVVNANHARSGEDRSAYDRMGRVVNVVKRSNGLYGDLEILKSHNLAESVFEAAERMPGLFGLSHTAKGRKRAGPRGVVVEAVESVQSVDLVGDPATVTGLYESRSSQVAKKVKDLQESLKKSRPGYAKALTEMVEAGLMSPGDTMAEPEPEAEPSAEGDHGQAILDAAKAVLDDASLDTATKLKKIKGLLGIMDAGATTTDAAAATSDTADDGSEESRRVQSNLRESLARLEARDRLRTAADDAGVKVSKALLESIRPNLTEAEAKALVNELRGVVSASGYKPRSATPTAPTKTKTTATVQESRTEAGKVPEGDGKTVGRWLNSK